MGLVVEEKTTRKLEDGYRAVFTLVAYTDDFHPDNEEGCYTCSIRIVNKDGKEIGEYYRLFLVQNFNNRHYNAFIRKFVQDQAYRQQFNNRNHIEEKRPQHLIDVELQEIIMKLNDLGLHTTYSCQGTKDYWMDRPYHSDGHSETAYISFEKQLPGDFLVIACRYPFLQVESNGIRTKNRKDNQCFSETMEKMIAEWASDTEKR